MSEDQPHTLGDVVWIHHPSLEVDVPGVGWLDEIRVNLMEGASHVDDPLDDLRRARVYWNAVEVESHPEENAQAECVAQAAPWP